MWHKCTNNWDLKANSRLPVVVASSHIQKNITRKCLDNWINVSCVSSIELSVYIGHYFLWYFNWISSKKTNHIFIGREIIKCLYLHSSWSFAVTVNTVCWISSFSSTSASYNALSKYGGLSFLSAIPIRMNFVTIYKRMTKKWGTIKN